MQSGERLGRGEPMNRRGVIYEAALAAYYGAQAGG
jgi:hypothetical protein